MLWQRATPSGERWRWRARCARTFHLSSSLNRTGIMARAFTPSSAPFSLPTAADPSRPQRHHQTPAWLKLRDQRRRDLLGTGCDDDLVVRS